RPHSDFPQWRKPPKHSPCLSEILITIGLFENDEQRASSRPSPKEKAIRARALLFGDADNIGLFKNDEQRY
ncbi:MAG: hypothetical protein ACXWWA_09720, partial [Chitinophagaceae bacterium]